MHASGLYEHQTQTRIHITRLGHVQHPEVLEVRVLYVCVQYSTGLVDVDRVRDT
jgi:hypothetical protein